MFRINKYNSFACQVLSIRENYFSYVKSIWHIESPHHGESVRRQSLSGRRVSCKGDAVAIRVLASCVLDKFHLLP